MVKLLFSHKIHQGLMHFWLLISRVVLSAFMFTHGLPKLQRLLNGNFEGFPDPLGIGSTYSLILTVIGEIVAPIMVAAGLATRLSSIPVIIAMGVAAFMVHATDPFQRKELALMYLVGFVAILILGGGKYSFDAVLNKRR